MALLLFYLFLAIGISFLCSILEAVLLSLTPGFVETTIRQNPRLGRRLKLVKDKIDESISGILILNTFAHTMGAAGVGAQASKLFGVQWEALIAVVLTLLILYLSEIIPKTIGATYWKQLASPASYLILWIKRLVLPLIWISSKLTSLFKADKSNAITREDIISLVALGKKSGSLGAQEQNYLSNILNLRNTLVPSPHDLKRH